MNEQQTFNCAAYHMLAHGGSPRDLFPDSRSNLVKDLERVHSHVHPAKWKEALDRLAHDYKLGAQP